jgi:hypothetical protein
VYVSVLVVHVTVSPAALRPPVHAMAVPVPPPASAAGAAIAAVPASAATAASPLEKPMSLPFLDNRDELFVPRGSQRKEHASDYLAQKGPVFLGQTDKSSVRISRS